MEYASTLNYVLIVISLIGSAAGVCTGLWILLQRYQAEGEYYWLCEWRNWFNINRQIGITVQFSTVSCIGYILLMADWFVSCGWQDIGIGATLAWMVYHLLTARSIVGFHQIVNYQQQEIHKLRNELRRLNR